VRLVNVVLLINVNEKFTVSGIVSIEHIKVFILLLLIVALL
jgi:hypothetical protein